MKDIRQRLLATFQIEHRDHVEQIRSLLAMMENTGTQPASPELEEVFRRAHSLKGAARAVDLRPIEGLAHRLETLFARVRHGECELTKDVNGVVLQVLDATEDCIANQSGQPSASFALALKAIERVLGMESEPPLEEAPAPVVNFQPMEMVRITAKNFEGLFRSADGVVTESQRQDQVTGKMCAILRELSLIEKESEQVRRSAVALGNLDHRRELSRMTLVLDSVARRIHTVTRQANAARRQHQRSAWAMHQLGRQLQQDVWQARMVPAESLLEGYRKMVRDLARDEGKEIEFHAFSEGVHADRRVLEALKDPIMHLLRNAVSHGLERPAERTANNKAPAGRLNLRVSSSGQQLSIAIEDDGRGVNLARVAEVAVRDGILSEAAAQASSDQELTRLLLRPGFSTSRTVSDLSGRGMGLSVVQEAMRRLQGDLDIRPAPHGGTAISLTVPLSITTHRLVLVRCAGTVFAIPSHSVERLERVRVPAVESVEGHSVVMLDGDRVPLTTIHTLLGLEREAHRAHPDYLLLAILRSGEKRMAVAVDAVLRETSAVIQDLGFASGCGGRIASGVALDDGSIAFVIRPAELLEGVTPSPSRILSFAEAPAIAADQPPPFILVVDDSMTTRTLEKSILEAHGYRVRVAVDGVEALACLREEKADLVIADIEMPRLTGFGLVEAMKKDPGLAQIPVIIVSSLDRREDQQRGLALGADAYIVKRRFEQGELLATIRQIL